MSAMPNTPDMSRFRERFSAELDRYGNVSRLADKAGVHRGTLYDWRNGGAGSHHCGDRCSGPKSSGLLARLPCRSSGRATGYFVPSRGVNEAIARLDDAIAHSSAMNQGASAVADRDRCGRSYVSRHVQWGGGVHDSALQPDVEATPPGGNGAARSCPGGLTSQASSVLNGRGAGSPSRNPASSSCCRPSASISPRFPSGERVSITVGGPRTESTRP